MDHFDVLIVGGGHAGATVAIKLRQNGFEGSIAIVGEESDAPYERPPLSKEYLAGKVSRSELGLRPDGYWAEQQVALVLGRRVVRVDAEGHVAICRGGDRFSYGNLVWAAGGTPRSLTCSGHDLHNVHAVRTRADVDVLRDELESAEDVVIIGGGFIGLEAAAVLTRAGKRVTLLEAADRLLARVAAPPVSTYFADLHRRHGVTIKTNVVVECISAAADGRLSVQTNVETDLVTDVVIVGIGIIPNVAPLIEAGALGTNGVDVDASCRTSLESVYAVGDCAAQLHPFAGADPVRIESIQNANGQGTVVADVLSGKPVPMSTVPWFWSNQFDVRMQTVGLARGWDEVVVRGEPETDSFSVVYLIEGQVIALDCINAAKDFIQGKRLVAERSVITRERLSDALLPLKTLR